MPRVIPLFALTLALAAPSARAQEFVPPDRGRPAAQQPQAAQSSPQSGGLRVGIFGFTSRVGWQVNKGSQAIIGTTVDIAQLFIPQVRLRPSFEMGIGDTSNAIGINLELIYRLQPDQAPAVPYVGLGVGYYNDKVSPTKVWPTVVMGFELPLRHGFNWLIEYHALDGLRRSRFLIGLAARGSN